MSSLDASSTTNTTATTKIDEQHLNVSSYYEKTKSHEVTFGKIRDDGLGDGLANSVHLGDVTSSLHANADINTLETIGSEEEERFLDLPAHGVGLDVLNGATVHLHNTFSFLAVGNSDGAFL
jgi:hypothetical protein